MDRVSSDALRLLKMWFNDDQTKVDDCSSLKAGVGSIRTHPSTSPCIWTRRRRQRRSSVSKTLNDSEQTTNWGRSLQIIHGEVVTGGQCSMWVWRARTDSWSHHQCQLPATRAWNTDDSELGSVATDHPWRSGDWRTVQHVSVASQNRQLITSSTAVHYIDHPPKLASSKLGHWPEHGYNKLSWQYDIRTKKKKEKLTDCILFSISGFKRLFFMSILRRSWFGDGRGTFPSSCKWYMYHQKEEHCAQSWRDTSYMRVCASETAFTYLILLLFFKCILLLWLFIPKTY